MRTKISINEPAAPIAIPGGRCLAERR